MIILNQSNRKIRYCLIYSNKFFIFLSRKNRIISNNSSANENEIDKKNKLIYEKLKKSDQLRNKENFIEKSNFNSIINNFNI